VEEENNKVAFDGRLQFYPLLKEHHIDIKNFSREGNTEGMFKSIRILISLVSPYISNKSKEKVKNLIKKCQELKKRNRKQDNLRMQEEYENKVFQLYDEVCQASKELMLPIQDKESDEYDWEEHDRKSDL